LGNPIPVSPLWSVNGGGSIDSTGLFSATTGGGPYTVTAVAGALSATGFVWVTAVNTNPLAPFFTSQPLSRSVGAGSNASFSVTAGGTAPLSYQWKLIGTNIVGANTNSYMRTGVQPADAGNYSVFVNNSVGTTNSANAVLTVVLPPAITVQPLSLAVAAGSNVTFSILSIGTGSLSYQWQFNGTNILGALTIAYTRTNAQSADAGTYTVIVANSAGSMTSTGAVLSVNNAPVLAAVSNLTIHAGSTAVVSNSATDADAPAQTLTFSLDPGFPAGADIDPTNGLFAWSSTAAQAGTTNPVTVRATDTGTPILSDSKSFVVVVVTPITIESITASNAAVTITWPAIPGDTYRVQYKDNPGARTWNSPLPDVTASGSTASATDILGTSERLYRVLLVR
jgi:hypothetical protein